MGDADPRPTVFLSYARADREHAARLVAALEAAGIDVWWDPLIEGGAAFAKSIASSLERCDAVVACWSRESVSSDWVLDEAGRGRDLHKLVPVTLDGSEPPLGFRQYHAIDLSNWGGAASDTRIAAIVRSVATTAGRRQVEGRDKSVRRPQVPAPAPISAISWTKRLFERRDRTIMIASAVLLGLAALAYLWWRDLLPAQSDGAASSPQTIAVLPFDNLSGDASFDYLGEGFSEELLNRLANVPGLQVSARTSSAYFGKDRQETVQTIGKMLGVAFLVEGSVRKAGNSLRVTAQLVDTRTGYHLWSQSFDRKFSDVLAIQDEISLAILEGLDVPVIAKARAAALGSTTTNADALDLFLQARRLDQKWELAANSRAIELYDRAIALDPKFASAYLHLANTIGARRQIAELRPDDPIFARIPELFRKAVELDPDSPDAHAMMAWSLFNSFDLRGMQRELELAENLNPSTELALYQLTQVYAFAGEPVEKALEYAERWVRIDPLNPWAACNVALAHQYSHRTDEALRTIDRVVVREPDYWVGHFIRAWLLNQTGRHADALQSARRAVELHDAAYTKADLAFSYAKTGDSNRARELLDEVLDPMRHGYVPPTHPGFVLEALGDTDAALASFERAFAERDPFVIPLLLGRLPTSLRNEPRFQELLRRLTAGQRPPQRLDRTSDRRNLLDQVAHHPERTIGLDLRVNFD